MRPALRFPRRFGPLQGHGWHAIFLAACVLIYAVAYVIVTPSTDVVLVPLLAIPCMLAGWWFGIRGGLVTLLGVTLLHVALDIHLGLDPMHLPLEEAPALLMLFTSSLVVGKIAGVVVERDFVADALHLRAAHHESAAKLRELATGDRDVATVARAAVVECAKLLPDAHVRLVRSAPDGFETLSEAGTGTSTPLPISQLAQAIARGSPFASPELRGDGRPKTPAARTRSMLIVPLAAADPPAVILAERTASPAFSRGEAQYVELVASILSSAMSRAIQQRDLVESEERYRRLAETALEGLIIHEKGAILEVNAAFARKFGADQAAFVGMPIFDLIDPASHDEVRKAVQEGASGAFRIVGRTLAGAPLHLEVQAAAITHQGRPARVVAIRDVTERDAAEAALRASEEQFRTLFENVTIGLYRTTPDGRVLLANPALVTMLGFRSFEELAARDVDARGEAERGRARAGWVARLDREGVILGHETVWQRADGSPIHIRESARAVRDASGNVIHYEGTVEDITERKRVEEALRQTDGVLMKLFENAPVGIMFADLEGRISQANDAFLEIVGHDRADLEAGLSWAKLTPPDWLQRAEVSRRELVSTGRCSLHEKEYIRKDGTRAPVMVASVLVDDQRARCVGFVLDIRERETARRALAASEARKSAILEAALDCVVTFDALGRILDFNAAASRAFGWSREEALGASVKSLLEDDVTAAVGDGLIGRRRETTATRKDGSGFPVELALVTVDTGASWLYTAFLRDLTEIKRLESERASQQELIARNERLGALGTLVAGVAHEINNPLMYISGNIELAIMDVLDAAAALNDIHAKGPDLVATARSLESALGGAERIAHITRALKAVARQRAPTDREFVDLNTVLANVEALLRVGIPDHVALERVQSATPLYAWANVAELHQVVLNLARNAFEAAPLDACTTVRLETLATASGVALRVRDDGPGIPNEVLPRIFTPFFTTKKQGTGLGLAIVHGIVQDHGGEITVVSKPGRGASFTVHMPKPPKGSAATPVADGRLAK